MDSLIELFRPILPPASAGMEGNFFHLVKIFHSHHLSGRFVFAFVVTVVLVFMSIRKLIPEKKKSLVGRLLFKTKVCNFKLFIHLQVFRAHSS